MKNLFYFSLYNSFAKIIEEFFYFSFVYCGREDINVGSAINYVSILHIYLSKYGYKFGKEEFPFGSCQE
jgi:hypothetical protein